ncbi:hypothetical protein PIB30_047561 [Stylosanthes scabra]|uniref:Uncharacterized protein n=1 Tax=Stylosanthes scabra TaxID=79078 RepID=A0ABU6UFF6_9FABA|nr:hypothetical protein [Stylosanthes scabra]
MEVCSACCVLQYGAHVSRRSCPQAVWGGAARTYGPYGSHTVHDIHRQGDYRETQEYFTCYVGEIGRGRFLSLTSRLDDPRWMFAPPDMPMSATHPRDELTMPEDAPARGRRNDAGGRGRRPPANAANMDEVQEEATEIGRREDEGDAGDQPHVSPARPQWFDHDNIGSSSMMQASHASQSAVVAHPQPFPVASPDPFLQCTFDVGSLDDVFDMIRAPDMIVMSQAVSYRTSKDHCLDPSSSTFVAPPHPSHGMGYTVSDLGGTGAQYETPPAYYDFMSGPIPTTTQARIAPTEPSPPPPPRRPIRTVRPPPCGTDGHLHHGSGYI